MMVEMVVWRYRWESVREWREECLRENKKIEKRARNGWAGQERIRWIENEWWGSDVVGGARVVPKNLTITFFFFNKKKKNLGRYRHSAKPSLCLLILIPKIVSTSFKSFIWNIKERYFLVSHTCFIFVPNISISST